MRNTRAYSIDLPMPKDSLLLLNKEVPHRSTPNRSDTVRWSIDLRHQKRECLPGDLSIPSLWLIESRFCSRSWMIMELGKICGFSP